MERMEMGWWRPGRMPENPWRCRSREIVWEGDPALTVHVDQVVRPDGSEGEYASVQCPDLVRVVMLMPDGTVPMIQQHHYLVGPAWQLPGGLVDSIRDEDPGLKFGDPYLAAFRELEEETGIIPRELHRIARLEPLPGLTPAAVHVFAGDEVANTVEPRCEPSEAAGMEVLYVTITDAVQAVADGRLRCAASAFAILTTAAANSDE